MAELCRVSERLVIVDYPSASSFARLESRWRKVRHGMGGKTEPYQVFSHKDISDAFKRSGFTIRSVHRQFVLPIAVHKMIGSQRFTLTVEGFLDRIHLREPFGSPVTLVAERCAF
jgi:hypothetical protein